MNRWILFIAFALIVVGIAVADSVNDMETLDGSQRNRLAGLVGSPSSTAMLLVDTYWTNGSTDTAICQFLNTRTNTGENTYWNYVTNSVEGTKITILSNGVYSLNIMGNPANSVQMVLGWSLNATALERQTVIHSISITNGNQVCYVNVNNSSAGQWPCTRIVALKQNDVIRPHGSPTSANNSQTNTPYANFSVTRIGN